jgi:hypothetical protein
MKVRRTLWLEIEFLEQAHHFHSVLKHRTEYSTVSRLLCKAVELGLACIAVANPELEAQPKPRPKAQELRFTCLPVSGAVLDGADKFHQFAYTHPL